MEVEPGAQPSTSDSTGEPESATRAASSNCRGARDTGIVLAKAPAKTKKVRRVGGTATSASSSSEGYIPTPQEYRAAIEKYATELQKQSMLGACANPAKSKNLDVCSRWEMSYE